MSVSYKIGDMVCFKTGHIKDVVRINSTPLVRSKVTYIDFFFKKNGRYRSIASDLIRHATPIEQKIKHRIDG